jgi:hypothetical protein
VGSPIEKFTLRPGDERPAAYVGAAVSVLILVTLPLANIANVYWPSVAVFVATWVAIILLIHRAAVFHGRTFRATVAWSFRWVWGQSFLRIRRVRDAHRRSGTGGPTE